jgi:hypothetical protein
MFSCDVVDTDKFLDMPVSARCLYYDLGMRADDDGFISPKKVLRLTGASDDDLRVLVARDFVIPFESGVIVIKDWKLNNYLRKDRYFPTKYTEEKSKLSLLENGSYTTIQTMNNMGLPLGIPDGAPRIEENRREEKSIDIPKGMDTSIPEGKNIVNLLQKALKDNYPIPLTGITDRKKLHNLIQVLSPRKGTDEWMDTDWKLNFVTFINLYLEATDEKYYVRSVDSLKERVKLWREYRGKLN